MHPASHSANRGGEGVSALAILHPILPIIYGPYHLVVTILQHAVK